MIVWTMSVDVRKSAFTASAYSIRPCRFAIIKHFDEILDFVFCWFIAAHFSSSSDGLMSAVFRGAGLLNSSLK